MAIVKEGDSEVRSSELETGLSSNFESEDLDIDTTVSKICNP